MHVMIRWTEAQILDPCESVFLLAFDARRALDGLAARFLSILGILSSFLDHCERFLY